MKIRTILLLITLGLASHAVMADPMDDGILAFLKGDTTSALQVFRPLAEGGNKDAQYQLGYMYQTGTGVVRNQKKAYYWYTLAAKQGHNSASIQARVVSRTLKN